LPSNLLSTANSRNPSGFDHMIQSLTIEKCRELYRTVKKKLYTRMWALFVIELLLVFLFGLAAPAKSLQPEYITYFIGGLVLVYVLAAFCKKKMPFPYAIRISTLEYMTWTIVPLLVVLGLSVLVGTATYFVENPYLFLLRFSTIFGAVLASITEESLKITMINAFALLLGRVLRRRLKRVYRIWIAGVVSVAIWTLGHIFYMHYGPTQLVFTFLIGIVLFYTVYRKRNFFPAIYVHLLWNTFFS